MSYISLYRKYRPQTFEDVVGQNVVIEILKNSIKNNNLSHAYIFSGPRGTGKTSIAKIFSKAVNCLDPINGDLCNSCEVCKSNFTDEIDIIEIDAASNNGVDEIREIRNNVKTMPSHLKYKVYIIDEVHMLSTSAFNALLKTLEEPPKYVIFILATTEFNKIPSTVISRCQKFDFKKISDEEIINRLKLILNKEDRKLNDDVIKLITKLSDGGLRDAINLMDQALSINNDNITIQNIYDMVGEISEDEIFELFDNIVKSNLKEVLIKIEKYQNEGKNFNTISNKLEILIKDILIYNNTDDYFSKEYVNKISKYSQIDIDRLIELSKILIDLSNQLMKNTNQKLLFEIYFIKIAMLFNDIKIEKKESKNNDDNKFEKQSVEENLIDNELINQRINNTLSEANIELKKQFLNKYIQINEYLSSKDYNSIASLLKKGIPEVVSNRNVLFTFKKNFEIVLFNKNYDEIQKLLKIIYNTKYIIVAVTIDEWNEIKKKYIEDKKNGITYKYIEEKEIKKNNKKNTELQNSVEDIFGNEYITM